MQLTKSRGKVEGITGFSDLGPSGCFTDFVEHEELGFLHPFTSPATVRAHVYFVHFFFDTQRLKRFQVDCGLQPMFSNLRPQTVSVPTV